MGRVKKFGKHKAKPKRKPAEPTRLPKQPLFEPTYDPSVVFVPELAASSSLILAPKPAKSSSAGLIKPDRIPPEVLSGFKADRYYDANGCERYHTESNSKLQAEITEAALRFVVPKLTLMRSPLQEKGPEAVRRPARLMLDLGSGSGFSIAATLKLVDAKPPRGKFNDLIIGCDISRDMLAQSQKHLRAKFPAGTLKHVGLVCCDFGQGLPFRADLFDSALSISALQWLNTPEQLGRMFSSLNTCMRPSARAVFQYYTGSPDYLSLVTRVSRQEHLLAASVMDMMHRSPKQKWVHLVEKPAPQHGSCPERPLPWCALSFPFDTPCALSLKRCLHGDRHEKPQTQLRNPSRVSMASWMYYTHADYALQLIFNASKVHPAIPFFQARKKFRPPAHAPVLAEGLLALLGPSPTWLVLTEKILGVVDILHSVPPAIPDDPLWRYA